MEKGGHYKWMLDVKPIFAIDPGPEKSAYVQYDPGMPQAPVVYWGHVYNPELRNVLCAHSTLSLLVGVIEDVAPYNLRVGLPFIDTCKWIARFQQVWGMQTGHHVVFLTRAQVCATLCGKANTTKGDVNGALYVKFGGDRKRAVGTQKKPGPLHGLKGEHVWDALALAVAWQERHQHER